MPYADLLNHRDAGEDNEDVHAKYEHAYDFSVSGFVVKATKPIKKGE